jgi:hypothetical protein
MNIIMNVISKIFKKHMLVAACLGFSLLGMNSLQGMFTTNSSNPNQQGFGSGGDDPRK